MDKSQSESILGLFQVVDESLQVVELIQESGGIVFHVKHHFLWRNFKGFILWFEDSAWAGRCFTSVREWGEERNIRDD